MRSYVQSILLLLVASSATCLASLTESATETAGPSYAAQDAQSAQDPLHMAAMTQMHAHASPRHRQEKAHLLKRMDRKTGTWGTSHPRYRLLEAIFAFSKYRERNLAELDRWRKLYTNVAKTQKQVSVEVPLSATSPHHDLDLREGYQISKQAR